MKSVLITGGARGIGAAAARLFAQAGYFVWINYRTSEKEALALAAELPFAKAVCADVAIEAEVARMAALTGVVDVLVNNAGISQIALFQDVSALEWERIFAVNVHGVFHCCRAFLPDMIRKKQGRIINISSMWGLCGASCEVGYSASKAAVIGLTRALAKEVAPSGITVNCVAPGLVDTAMNRGLSKEALAGALEEIPLGQIGTPQDIARAIFFLAGEGAAFITGQVLSPNGGQVMG